MLSLLFKTIVTILLARSVYLYIKPIIPRTVNEEALREFRTYSWPKKTLTVIFGVPLILIWEIIPNYISKVPEVLGGWLWDNILHPGLNLIGRGIKWLAIKVWDYVLVPIGQALIRFFEWLSNKISAFLEAIKDLIVGFNKWLSNKISAFLEAIKDLIIKFAIKVWDCVLVPIDQTIVRFIKWLSDGIVPFLVTVKNLFVSFVDWLSDKVTLFLTAIKDLVKWLAIKVWDYVLVPTGRALVTFIKWLATKIRDYVLVPIGQTLIRFIEWLSIKAIAAKDFIIYYSIIAWDYLYSWFGVIYEIGRVIVNWFLEKLWLIYITLCNIGWYLWSYIPHCSGIIKAKLAVLWTGVIAMVSPVLAFVANMVIIAWTGVTAIVSAMRDFITNMVIIAWTGAVAMSNAVWVSASNMANLGWIAASNAINTIFG